MCVLMTESKGRWTGKISEERQEETQLQAQCMMATQGNYCLLAIQVNIT